MRAKDRDKRLLRRARRALRLLPVAVFLLVTLASAAGPEYTVDWWTVDGGGGTLAGGVYTLSGTAGQPDVALWQGDGYALSGGFWGGTEAGEYAVYLPLALRNSQ